MDYMQWFGYKFISQEGIVEVIISSKASNIYYTVLVFSCLQFDGNPGPNIAKCSIFWVLPSNSPAV